MAQVITGEERAQLPWVVLRLEQTNYAIHSRWIQSIMELSEQVVTTIPAMPPNIRGILNLRGSVVPLLGLRSLFGLETTEEQVEAFHNMIELRKDDHICWVQQLEESYTTGVEFSLSTNAHLCAFGVWYDNFKTSNLALIHALKKIEEPHDKLHMTATQVLHSDCPPEEAAALLDLAQNTYVPAITGLLDQAATLYADMRREMVVTLHNGEQHIGVVVDEVLAVEQLKLISDMSDNPLRSRYVAGIARSEKIQGEILMLEDALLLSAAQGVALYDFSSVLSMAEEPA